MTNDIKGLINIRESPNEKVMIGDGTKMVCKAKGSLRLRADIKGIMKVDILLKEDLFVPELKTNLLSLDGVT